MMRTGQRMPKLTLCTYTYDDGPMPDGLPASLGRQTRQPNEIPVIDDGSGTPCRPPESAPPLRLVRFESNRGNTYVRTFAASEAGGDVVACMGCDIRPPGQLAESLP
jgi:hypothetical protein